MRLLHPTRLPHLPRHLDPLRDTLRLGPAKVYAMGPAVALAGALALGLSPLTAAQAAVRTDTTGGHLTVSVDDGDGHVSTQTLDCTVRDTRAACDRLERLGGPIGPTPPGQMCSMIYGGSQTAHVIGDWHGTVVDQTYSRRDGCEITRWQRMDPVLPSADLDGPHSTAVPPDQQGPVSPPAALLR